MVHICSSCERNFTTHRGLNIHRASCKVKPPEVIQIINNDSNRSFNVNGSFNVHQNYEEVETTMIVDKEDILPLELEEIYMS